MVPVRCVVRGREYRLTDIAMPLDLAVPGHDSGADRSEWEVEIGFGKGRFLLDQAALRPQTGFVGIEIASKYYRLVRRRARRRGLENVVLLRGEALYLASAVLPRSFARVVHVYFPDPWPKSRHQRRRLFDPESVDLVLRMMRSGGSLCFATDHLEYGKSVRELLAAHPALTVRELKGPWDGRARTNYEAKYQLEGRAILRLEARLDEVGGLLHPLGRSQVLTGCAPRSEEGEE